MLSFVNMTLLVISSFLFVLLYLKSKQLKNLSSVCKNQATILNAISLPIFYKDKNGKFLGCNKAFDNNFKEFKQRAINELKEFRTTITKEIDITYDNNIKKATIVNFTNYLDGAVGILFDISQMKTDKLSLLHKKENLELILKGSQDGHWEWDTKTNDIIFSKKAKDILGYKDHEKAPSSISDWMNLVESYDIAKTNEELCKHTKGESNFIDIEHRLKTSLNDLWVNFRGKGIYNSKNEITKVYGTIRDITKQKTELEKIIKQKDLFKTFMDNLPAISFMKNKQGQYIYMNNYYQKLLGFKSWKGKTSQDLFSKDVSRSIIESDREAFYEGKYKHEEFITNEEGKEKLFETYKFPIDREDDKILCGFGLDITKEKIYQDEIELYSKIFNNTNEAIILTDKNGIIIAINNAFKEATGYSSQEVIGKNPNIRQSGKHNKNFYKNMWYDILKKGSWSGDIFNKHKDGTIVPELMNISSIKNSKNEITNFVGIFQSIKRQKIVESQLKKMAHYDNLTKLPNRTLFYDRLEQAIQRAKRNDTIIALIFIDLDDFKIINDTLGHSEGDATLKIVAKKLSEIVRDTDTVARLGGDEFVILLEKIEKLTDITHVAKKIITEIKNPMRLKNSSAYTIGACLGISIYPNQTLDKKELLDFADIAMYEAKNSGKNCYKIYENN